MGTAETGSPGPPLPGVHLQGIKMQLALIPQKRPPPVWDFLWYGCPKSKVNLAI